MSRSTLGSTQPQRVRRRLGRALRRRRRLRVGLVQLVYASAALGLALMLPQIDTGDFSVDSTRTATFMLSVGGGIIAFTGLVYSLLFLVVQFGTTTYTPRLNLFRDSPIVWHVFAYFVAVFVYSMVAPFTFGAKDEISAVVPLTLAVLAFVAFGMLRQLQQTALASIQLASVLDQAELRGRAVIAGLYPELIGDGTPAEMPDLNAATRHDVLWPGRNMVLQVIDVPRLTRLAERHDLVVECVAEIGDTVREGEVVARTYGTNAGALDRTMLSTFGTGSERTFEQDPGLALRVVVDIALRAMSTAINDPTTSVQAVDRLDSLMRALAVRELDIHHVEDASGTVRVVLRLPGWDQYVALAFDEILVYGRAMSQVMTRLVEVLELLIEYVPDARRAALEPRLIRARAWAEHTMDPPHPRGA